MPKFKLIGLVEPVNEASREAFEEWYLGNHIEDVSHTPGIIRATTHRLIKPFMKTTPPNTLQSTNLKLRKWETPLMLYVNILQNRHGPAINHRTVLSRY
ncbi:hypothetical protein ACFL9T_18885 [Thermodesulfobacteriota bacterium]